MYYSKRKRQYLSLYICIPENVTSPKDIHVVYAKDQYACLQELESITKDKNIKWHLTLVTTRGYYNKIHDPEQAYIREVE